MRKTYTNLVVNLPPENCTTASTTAAAAALTGVERQRIRALTGGAQTRTPPLARFHDVSSRGTLSVPGRNGRRLAHVQFINYNNIKQRGLAGTWKQPGGSFSTSRTRPRRISGNWSDVRLRRVRGKWLVNLGWHEVEVTQYRRGGERGGGYVIVAA